MLPNIKVRKWLEKLTKRKPVKEVPSQDLAEVHSNDENGENDSRKQLDLSWSRGSSISNALERNVQVLKIRSSGLTSFDNEILHCDDLRVLDLSDNSLRFLPPGVASLIALEELYLGRNQFSQLPETLKCCRKLSVVQLDFNDLPEFPRCLPELYSLTELSLNSCGLTSLPPSVSMLCHLQSLELRGNALTTLPKSIGRLVRLSFLDLGHNRLAQLPDTLPNIGLSLRTLLADWNELMSLPQDFDELSNLEYLDLSGNFLTGIPAVVVEKLARLTHFYLSDNQLAQLPNAFNPYSTLESLHLDGNYLTQIPSSLYRLPLKELSVRNNKLITLGNEICFLKKLEVLFADRNILQTLPSEIYMCRKLRIFSVRSNQIQAVPTALGTLPNLTVVDLRGNQIVHLPGSFKKHPSIVALWLNDNQTTPFVPLVTTVDTLTGKEKLTCHYLLPQKPSHAESDYNIEKCWSVSGLDLFNRDVAVRAKRFNVLTAEKIGDNKKANKGPLTHLLPSSILLKKDQRPIRPYAMMDLTTLQAQYLAKENKDYETIYPKVPKRKPVILSLDASPRPLSVITENYDRPNIKTQTRFQSLNSLDMDHRRRHRNNAALMTKSMFQPIAEANSQKIESLLMESKDLNLISDEDFHSMSESRESSRCSGNVLSNASSPSVQSSVRSANQRSWYKDIDC